MSATKRRRYEAMLEEARSLDDSAVRAGLRALATDDRGAVVLAWLERYRSSWEKAVARQDLAAEPGKLTHAAGSLHAVRVLMQGLRLAIEDRKEVGIGPQPPDS